MDADNTLDPVRSFAEHLRRLQRDAGGPSVRDLVRLTARVGAPYTRGTLQDKLAGRSAPTWELVEAFVRACALHEGSTGEPDLRQWRDRHARMTRELAAHRAGRRRTIREDMCPYRGLEAFTTEHSHWFHGRSGAVHEVLAGLASYRKGLVILGPSGAGKTSLVQAGVLPALAAGEVPGSDRWRPVLVRPGKDLGAEIDRAGLAGDLPAAVAARLSSEPPDTRLLLIVDQFEEALLSAGETTRLAEAVGTPGLTLVLVLRDDFYPSLAAEAPDLLRTLMPGLLNVPATVNVDELRDIVLLPAEAVGLRCADGLADRIIGDVLKAEPEATRLRRAPITVLPLLELTLSQLWQRRRDGQLTHEAYQSVGGVAGAVTTWCDTAVERLPIEHRPSARLILTTLVRPPDEARHIPAVRQQAPLSDLRDLAEQDEILGLLIDQRIVTTRTAGGVPVAELAHEALIREWPALREWVEQDHRFQDWLRRAGERQANWARHRHPGDLLHGTDLAEGLDFARQRRLPQQLAVFLAASQHEEKATIRRVRRFNAVLAALLVLAATAAGLAVWQRETAIDARQTALSRQLAAQSAAQLMVDPDQASTLAARAYRASGTAEATGALYAAAGSPLLGELTSDAMDWSPLAFSPDGRVLATVTDRYAVQLWNPATGEPTATFAEQTSPVWAMAISPDGRTLAATHEDGTARLWDLASRQPRATLTGRTDVDFSPDGRTVVTAGEDGVRLWNMTDGRAVSTLDDDGMYCASFAPKSRSVLTSSEDRVVQLWTPPRSRIVDDAALCGIFSPDGRIVAAFGDGTARLRDSRTGRLQASIPDVNGLEYSPDGRTLGLVDLDGTVRLWDTAGRRTRLTLPGTGVVSLAFSPDSRVLATTTSVRAGAVQGVVRLWDATAGLPGATLAAHTDVVNAVAFSPDGRTLVTGGDDGTAREWDLSRREDTVFLDIPNGAVTAVVYSPDGRTIATGSDNATVDLWDTTTRTRRTSMPAESPYDLAFSPDSTTVAGAGWRSGQLWDAATGAPGPTLSGHVEDLTGIDFSPDGRTVATSSIDDSVALWSGSENVQRPRQILAGLNDINAVAFDPRGRLLAGAGSDNTVRLWDPSTGRPRATLFGHTGPVRAVAFNPAGDILASAGDDDTVRLWDAGTSQLRATLVGHTGDVRAVAFNSDGRTLATAGADHVVHLWPVESLTPAIALEKLCRIVREACPP